MDLKTATDDEISEYKSKWKPSGYIVKVKSDMDIKGKRWCRQNVDRWSWSMDSFVDDTHHQFIFEKARHATDFAVGIGVSFEKEKE